VFPCISLHSPFATSQNLTCHYTICIFGHVIPAVSRPAVISNLPVRGPLPFLGTQQKNIHSMETCSSLELPSVQAQIFTQSALHIIYQTQAINCISMNLIDTYNYLKCYVPLQINQCSLSTLAIWKLSFLQTIF